MKKFFKIFSIITVNILLLIILLFISDFILYKLSVNPKKYFEENPLSDSIPKFHYELKEPNITFIELDDYFDGQDDISRGRKPAGLQYCSEAKKNNCHPIVLFGDSFAHGQYLHYNQNFGFKLSNALKRPVYIRAIPGSGIQHMYYQVSDDMVKSFYDQVPPTDTVFYILIDDHFLRMMIFSDFDIPGGHVFLRYTLKNHKLIKDNYQNKFLNLLKASYTIRAVNLKYLDFILKNNLCADKLTDFMLEYFVQTRSILEKKWNKKINFTVIFYDNDEINYKNLLRKKLEDNNFTVIDTDELTNEDLNSEKYLMQDNLHPTEAAWDLLTPLIIKKARL